MHKDTVGRQTLTDAAGLLHDAMIIEGKIYQKNVQEANNQHVGIGVAPCCRSMMLSLQLVVAADRQLKGTVLVQTDHRPQ